MNINSTCPFFMRDVYLYDISACHYSILREMNFDLSKLDKDDKTQRNIQIGLMMRERPELVNILRDITTSTVSEHLTRNNIKEDDIVTRQYDGIILRRPLKNKNQEYLPLELRSIYQTFIISSDRKSYMAFDGKEISIKGVSHKYEEMNEFMGRLVRMSYMNKTDIFKNLQKLKDEFMGSDDPDLFCIPVGEGEYNIFVKGMGEVRITENMVNLLDVDEIDRSRYFDFYLRPFTESICLEFA